MGLEGVGWDEAGTEHPCFKTYYSCALLIHNNGFHHLHLWRDLASLSSWHMAGLAHACILDDACVDRHP